MAHKRQLIRDALKAMILSNTDAGTNVYSNRVTKAWQTELPMIKILYGSETALPRAVNSRQSIRNLSLIVEVIAEANENLDDTLDTLSQQVEQIIAADYSISGNALSSILTSTEPSFDGEGESVVGKLTLNFETKYIE